MRTIPIAPTKNVLGKVQLRGGFSDRNNINNISTQIQLTDFDERTRTIIRNKIQIAFGQISASVTSSFGATWRDMYLSVMEEVYCLDITQLVYGDESSLCQIFNQYIESTIKNDTYDSILTLIVALLCMLSVAIGVISYNVEQPLIYNILIALGAFPLTIGALYMVCKAFLSTNMTNEKADTLTVAILLFVGIGLVTGIVLEYLVTNEDLRGILTTIFSAILGGTITLTGVAWTIKAGNDKQQKEIARIENERKEEERKKYVPFVNLYTDKCNNPDHTITIPDTTFSCSCKKKYYIFESCFLKNTDFSTFLISEIIINNYSIYIRPHSYIDKQWIIKIKFKRCLVLDESVQYLGIQVKDMLGNIYNIALDFETICYKNGFVKIKCKGCYPAELVLPKTNEQGESK